MIGQFNPATIYVQTAFVIAGGSQNIIAVRATDAASELANDLVWIKNKVG